MLDSSSNSRVGQDRDLAVFYTKNKRSYLFKWILVKQTLRASLGTHSSLFTSSHNSEKATTHRILLTNAWSV